MPYLPPLEFWSPDRLGFFLVLRQCSKFLLDIGAFEEAPLIKQLYGSQQRQIEGQSPIGPGEILGDPKRSDELVESRHGAATCSRVAFGAAQQQPAHIPKVGASKKTPE